MHVASHLRNLARHALNLALPARCLKCGEIIAAQGGLCAPCWSRLGWVGEPMCACCGTPFEFGVGESQICATCLAQRPPFERARAALRYDEESRQLLLRFKHADRTDAAPALAGMMARAGGDLIRDADWLVPVPLHWTRLWRRRFNQAALLARELSMVTGKQHLARALVRTRQTPSQGHLSRLARGRNVRGAFKVAASHEPKIAGRRALVIDDVMTTGATVSGCARALLDAGAAKVDVLALAMVPQK